MWLRLTKSFMGIFHIYIYIHIHSRRVVLALVVFVGRTHISFLFIYCTCMQLEVGWDGMGRFCGDVEVGDSDLGFGTRLATQCGTRR
jgi:hypothetical protein